MDPNYSADTHTRAGTIGGFIFALFLQVHSADLERTAILAAVGGLVSFAVSMGLRMLVKWIKK